MAKGHSAGGEAYRADERPPIAERQTHWATFLDESSAPRYKSP